MVNENLTLIQKKNKNIKLDFDTQEKNKNIKFDFDKFDKLFIKTKSETSKISDN